MSRRRWTLLTLAAVIAIGCDDPRRSPGTQRKTGTVTIGDFTWQVEIADTPELRYLGLSGREGLADDEGMLFVYEDAAERSFCMRQMTFPLDIAFMDSNLRVVRIYTMPVEPDGAGTATYPSYAPAQYVLEVNAGMFAELGIDVGDLATIDR